MHVMDAIHCMHVSACKPFHRTVELLHHLVVLEYVAGNGGGRRGDLIARDFIAAAVDGVEQRLRQIYPRPEELHLLA